MVKTVIVTGAAGQDGSYMVDFLMENTPHRIIAVMSPRNSFEGFPYLSKYLHTPRFVLEVADLTNKTAVNGLVETYDPEYFINFAGRSSVSSSWQNAVEVADVNTLGVVRCLEAIRRYAPMCRFFNAGSSEEFGQPQYTPQDENHPIAPRNPYGASKASARHYISIYKRMYGLYAVQGIMYNHESERRSGDFVTRKITREVARVKYALDNMQEFAPIELGALDACRDWSHAKDMVRAVWLMLQNGQPTDYVLASGEARTVRGFVEEAFKAAGFHQRVWFGTGMKECLYLGHTKVLCVNQKHFRTSDTEMLCGNSNLIKKELGWETTISFADLVEGMVHHDINSFTAQPS